MRITKVIKFHAVQMKLSVGFYHHFFSSNALLLWVRLIRDKKKTEFRSNTNTNNRNKIWIIIVINIRLMKRFSTTTNNIIKFFRFLFFISKYLFEILSALEMNQHKIIMQFILIRRRENQQQINDDFSNNINKMYNLNEWERKLRQNLVNYNLTKIQQQQQQKKNYEATNFLIKIMSVWTIEYIDISPLRC